MLASGVVLIHTWVTASGSVTLFLMVNRWYTGSRSPRVSPHYCFVGGVKFLQGEGSAVIHRKKNYLVYSDVTCLCEFTCNRKQVVNRLKIPQGLSTLLFRRWSEVPSRGGVRGDSP